MDFRDKRHRLVDYLSAEIKDKPTLAALRKVPRELFLPPEYQPDAYNNEPAPIGYEQTVSQPLIVAMMTEALALTGTEKVLEVGTGSGYQTAILAELAREIHSTERIPQLAAKAKKTLTRLGYRNICLHPAGETLGWEPDAPYDAIIVTAAAPDIPETLLAQLTTGGRMVIPVGGRWEQMLQKITRLASGLQIINLGGCRFVSLIGKDAWDQL